MNSEEYLQHLYERAGNRAFESRLILVDNPDLLEPPSLEESLTLTQEHLSETARNALSVLNNPSNGVKDEDWKNFLWKLAAFDNMQDAFNLPLHAGIDLTNIASLYYFYFESRQILTEAILCSLNGFTHASASLLRLFLEFSLRQNYFVRTVKQTESYSSLNEYFKHGHAPNENTVLKHCLPNDSFSSTIRFRVQLELKGLSNSSNHPYHPGISPSQDRGYSMDMTLDGLFFWTLIGFVLDSALWIYYANFPMLFFPLNAVEKFGFNVPFGLLVNSTVAKFIEKSLGDNYDVFLKHAKLDDEAQSIIEWYNSLPLLNEDEIIKTWNDEENEFRGIREGTALITANMRALRAAASLIKIKKSAEDKTNNNDFKNYMKFDVWEAMKRKKK